jgi:putative PIN family toxin of toxin-antitoxin system
MIYRVVFDTNILFSAIGWRGNPHRCVQAARQRRCSSITCEPILAELAEQLRLKRGFDARRAEEAAEAIRTFSQVVAIGGGLKVVAADPDDDAVVECAVVAEAHFIVSGDKHLLGLGKHQDITILRATDFLSLL